jgi:hypothetical protein
MEPFGKIEISVQAVLWYHTEGRTHRGGLFVDGRQGPQGYSGFGTYEPLSCNRGSTGIWREEDLTRRMNETDTGRERPLRDLLAYVLGVQCLISGMLGFKAPPVLGASAGQPPAPAPGLQ